MKLSSKGIASLLILLLIGFLFAGIILGPGLLRTYRFQQYGKPESEDNPFVSGSEELKSCMREAIGDKAFRDIAQDKRPPTDKERQKLKVCWPNRAAGGETRENPFAKESEETKRCLREAVGSTAFEEISQGRRAPTEEEEQSLRVCFEQGSH